MVKEIFVYAVEGLLVALVECAVSLCLRSHYARVVVSGPALVGYEQKVGRAVGGQVCGCGAGVVSGIKMESCIFYLFDAQWHAWSEVSRKAARYVRGDLPDAKKSQYVVDAVVHAVTVVTDTWAIAAFDIGIIKSSSQPVTGVRDRRIIKIATDDDVGRGLLFKVGHDEICLACAFDCCIAQFLD